MFELFIVYKILKRLTKPFVEWDAYKLGIIDADGNTLKSRNELNTSKERNAWTKLDVLATNLRKILISVPLGRKSIASYAATLYLLREHNELIENELSEDTLRESLNTYMELIEDAPVNSAGSGNVAGIGVGEDGEPGLTLKQMKRYKKKRNILRRKQER